MQYSNLRRAREKHQSQNREDSQRFRSIEESGCFKMLYHDYLRFLVTKEEVTGIRTRTVTRDNSNKLDLVEMWVDNRLCACSELSLHIR